jgi:phosphate/sulfate permease
MAASIATGALKPRVAVMISAVLNFTGAFISISVAAIAKGIVDPKVLAGNAGLELVFQANQIGTGRCVGSSAGLTSSSPGVSIRSGEPLG